MRKRTGGFRLPRLPPSLYCLAAGLLCGFVFLHVQQVRQLPVSETRLNDPTGPQKQRLLREQVEPATMGQQDVPSSTETSFADLQTSLQHALSHPEASSQPASGGREGIAKQGAAHSATSADVATASGGSQHVGIQSGVKIENAASTTELVSHRTPFTKYKKTIVIKSQFRTSRDTGGLQHPTSFGSLVKATEDPALVGSPSQRAHIPPGLAAENAKRMAQAYAMGVPHELLYYGSMTNESDSVANGSSASGIFGAAASFLGVSKAHSGIKEGDSGKARLTEPVFPSSDATEQQLGDTGGLGLPALSQKLVAGAALDGVVFVTYVDASMLDFAFNWVESLEEWGVLNFLVGALDVRSSRRLQASGVAGFSMVDSGIPLPGPEAGAALAQEGSNLAGQQKAFILGALLSYGVHVIFTEADVVWMHDPSEHLEQYQHIDMLTGSNALSTALQPGDDGLEALHDFQKGTMCTGILVLRHSNATSAAMSAWAARLRAFPAENETAAFERLAQPETAAAAAHKELADEATDGFAAREFKGFEDSVLIAILPIAGFANGHTYAVQRLFQRQEIDPFAVHANMQIGGLAAKRWRLREAGLWYDSPSYYDQGAFMEVRELTSPGRPDGFQLWGSQRMIEYHLLAMHTQLAQLRQALAMASTLGRTLIMPTLVCYCDWHVLPGNRCRSPGVKDMWLPFACPLDYVLHVAHFDDLPESHGTRISIRERGFLNNPRVPTTLKESQRLVVPAHVKGLVPGRQNLEVTRQNIPMFPSNKQLRHMLAPLDNVKVLAFRDVAKAFGGFEQPEEARAFAKRVRHLASVFCCKEDGSKAAYSFLSDDAPTAVT